MNERVGYQLTPAPFTAVTVVDDFWSPRLETNRAVTVPYDFRKCEETGRMDNFAKAAGWMPGKHEGIFFNDSDVFKVIEGAAYTLSLQPDAELDRYLDDLIAKIAAAQEEDGYLYTARTIDPDHVNEQVGATRWSNLRVNHELYNVGHLYEAAVAHFQATGKRTLLDVALTNADLIHQVFGPGKRRDVPGHQEIEVGLVKLYRTTGDEKYLRLARFFLDERGHANGRPLYANFDEPGYMQDHLPVVEQREAVGHAVRAGYMYSGMADVAALTGDAAYVAAIDGIWQDVVATKLYVTGGIGARHQGEAFGAAYELPNATAYNETCAAIANVLWNHRIFLLHGHADYLDVLERVLYNGFLSGVSMTGDTFFYPNPLAFDGEMTFNKGSATRAPWFDCSCCPTNVVRFIPSLPGYVYAHTDTNLYVNLFLGGWATVPMAADPVEVRQETRYPWDGGIRITLQPPRPMAFSLHVRVPGWAQNRPVPSDLYTYLAAPVDPYTLAVNEERVDAPLERGFARIERVWQPGDVVHLELPMAVRRVTSHERVIENRGRVALERGPLVYCVEEVDNGKGLTELSMPDDLPLRAEHRSDLLGGVTVIQGDTQGGERPILAIPYYAWAHRGQGEMNVWLRREANKAQS